MDGQINKLGLCWCSCQDVPPLCGIVRLEDIVTGVPDQGPNTDGNPVLMILRIPIAVNGTLSLPLYYTRCLTVPSQILRSDSRLGVELVVSSLRDIRSEN